MLKLLLEHHQFLKGWWHKTFLFVIKQKWNQFVILTQKPKMGILNSVDQVPIISIINSFIEFKQIPLKVENSLRIFNFISINHYNLWLLPIIGSAIKKALNLCFTSFCYWNNLKRKYVNWRFLHSAKILRAVKKKCQKPTKINLYSCRFQGKTGAKTNVSASVSVAAVLLVVSSVMVTAGSIKQPVWLWMCKPKTNVVVWRISFLFALFIFSFFIFQLLA